VRNNHKILCNIYGSAAVNRSSNGRWEKRVTVSGTGKSELHDLRLSDRSVAAVSPEML
jgi:hypothetical protein